MNTAYGKSDRVTEEVLSDLDKLDAKAVRAHFTPMSGVIYLICWIHRLVQEVRVLKSSPSGDVAPTDGRKRGE